MPKIERVNATSDLNNIEAIIERDGCVVIEGLLDDGTLTKLQNELASNLAQIKPCEGDFYGYNTKRMSGLVKKSAMSRDLIVKPVVLGIMDRFLLKSCRTYQLHLTQAIQIGPGEPKQIMHRDDLMFSYGHEGVEAMINCMWAIDDFTEANGATHIVPGSHRWPRDRKATPEETIQGVMKAGSVLVYVGSLLHSGGANQTEHPRTGLVTSYSLGWLKQAENQFLSMSLEETAKLPEPLQRLMGYFVHEPNLGCVEGQDPILLLKGVNLSERVFIEFIPADVRPIVAEYRENALKAAK